MRAVFYSLRSWASNCELCCLAADSGLQRLLSSRMSSVPGATCACWGVVVADMREMACTREASADWVQCDNKPMDTNAAIEKLYFHQSPFAQARTSCSEVATLSPRIESASPDLTVAPLASDSSVARLLAPLALPPCEKKGIISLPERS